MEERAVACLVTTCVLRVQATTVSVEELQRLADEKERVDAELAKRATAVRV